MSAPRAMRFSPLNFRRLPEDFSSKIRTEDGMTLILVQTCGAARYGRTRADKDAIVAQRCDEDLLLLAWPGRYRTDIFLLERADIDRHYAAQKPSAPAPKNFPISDSK